MADACEPDVRRAGTRVDNPTAIVTTKVASVREPRKRKSRKRDRIAATDRRPTETDWPVRSARLLALFAILRRIGGGLRALNLNGKKDLHGRRKVGGTGFTPGFRSIYRPLICGSSAHPLLVRRRALAGATAGPPVGIGQWPYRGTCRWPGSVSDHTQPRCGWDRAITRTRLRDPWGSFDVDLETCPWRSELVTHRCLLLHYGRDRKGCHW